MSIYTMTHTGAELDAAIALQQNRFAMQNAAAEKDVARGKEFVDTATGTIKIGTLAGIDRTQWWRPPDMPDITSIPWHQAPVRNGHCQSYVTVDTKDPHYNYEVPIDIYVSGYGIVQVGHIDLDVGSFVPEETYNSGEYGPTYHVMVPTDGERYKVIYIDSGTRGSGGGANARISGYAPLIEMVQESHDTYEHLSPYPTVTMKYLTLRGHTGFKGSKDSDIFKTTQYIDMSGVDATSITSGLYTAFKDFNNLECIKYPEIQVDLTGGTSRYNVSNMHTNNYLLREADFSKVAVVGNLVSLENMFDNCYCLKTVDLSKWNLSTLTYFSSGVFGKCYSLEELKVKSLPDLNMSFADCSRLNNVSLINIANALPISNKTLTLHATPKAKLSTIMGTVTDGIFIASESGDISLLAFINNTKGWTVA